MPPSRDADELERRVAEAEGAAGGDADRDPVEDEGGAVVDHRLPFDQQPHPLGGAEAAEDRGRGDGVGGGEDGAEHRRLGPAQPGHEGVGDERDHRRGEEDQADREQRQRPHQRPQLLRGGAPAGGVDQRRQEDEEDRRRGRVRSSGSPGISAIPSPPSTSTIGAGMLPNSASADQQGRGEEQQQDRLDVVHEHITSGSVDERLAPPLEEIDHLRGEPDAPLQLVMFGDFQCPFCLGAQSVVRRVRERLGERLVFSFRHLPIPERHPLAPAAAEAGESADDQGRFWEYHDALFMAQPKLSRETMLEVGRDLGLDAERMAAEIDSERPRRAPRPRPRLGRGQRRHRHSHLLRQRRPPLRRLRRLLAGRGAGGLSAGAALWVRAYMCPPLTSQSSSIRRGFNRAHAELRARHRLARGAGAGARGGGCRGSISAPSATPGRDLGIGDIRVCAIAAEPGEEEFEEPICQLTASNGNYLLTSRAGRRILGPVWIPVRRAELRQDRRRWSGRDRRHDD